MQNSYGHVHGKLLWMAVLMIVAAQLSATTAAVARLQ